MDYGESFPLVEIQGLYHDRIVKNLSFDELEADLQNPYLAHQFPTLGLYVTLN